MKQKRKIWMLMLAAGLAVSLVACEKPPQAPEMYIEKAQLTKQENGIAALLGVGSGQLIYDFALDENIKSVQISTYRLENGSWTVLQSSHGGFSNPKGRLALGFDDLAGGLRTAVQDGDEIGSSSYTPNPKPDFSGMARATSQLNNRAAIVYEQEIPLAIQISTTKNEIRSYDVDAFFTPENYAQQGYEHVYAVTVLFSKEELDDSPSPDEHPVEPRDFLQQFKK